MCALCTRLAPSSCPPPPLFSLLQSASKYFAGLGGAETSSELHDHLRPATFVRAAFASGNVVLCAVDRAQLAPPYILHVSEYSSVCLRLSFWKITLSAALLVAVSH